MSFQPSEIIATLARHDVEYVLIGGVAATLHGSPHVTVDVDITPRRALANLERLSAALRDLGARVRVEGVPEGLPFEHDGRSLADAAGWNLTCRFGDVDITFVPSGTQGYEDLARDAVTIVLGGADVRVASLADIVRSKEAAGRPKDRLTLPTLRRMLEAKTDLTP